MNKSNISNFDFFNVIEGEVAEVIFLKDGEHLVFLYDMLLLADKRNLLQTQIGDLILFWIFKTLHSKTKSTREAKQVFLKYINYFIALFAQCGIGFNEVFITWYGLHCNRCLYCGHKLQIKDKAESFHFFCNKKGLRHKESFYEDSPRGIATTLRQLAEYCQKAKINSGKAEEKLLFAVRAFSNQVVKKVLRFNDDIRYATVPDKIFNPFMNVYFAKNNHPVDFIDRQIKIAKRDFHSELILNSLNLDVLVEEYMSELNSKFTHRLPKQAKKQYKSELIKRQIKKDFSSIFKKLYPKPPEGILTDLLGNF